MDEVAVEMGTRSWSASHFGSLANCLGNYGAVDWLSFFLWLTSLTLSFSMLNTQKSDARNAQKKIKSAGSP